MVLGKLPVPGRPTIWMIVGQGPTALAVGAGGGCLDIFTLLYPFSPFSLSLGEYNVQCNTMYSDKKKKQCAATIAFIASLLSTLNGEPERKTVFIHAHGRRLYSYWF